jgi:hypothetical protein
MEVVLLAPDPGCSRCPLTLGILTFFVFLLAGGKWNSESQLDFQN